MTTLQGHSKKVNSVAFSTDSKLLLSGGDDKNIILWNVETQKEVFTLKGSGSKISSVAISADGKYLASGLKDNMLKLWSVEK
jgi:WD40 repeat protein